MQLELFQPKKAKIASNTRVGDCFIRNNEVLMRVKPTHYLLNSTLINDCINANKIFVVNIHKGTLWCIPGSETVTPVEVKAVVSE